MFELKHKVAPRLAENILLIFPFKNGSSGFGKKTKMWTVDRSRKSKDKNASMVYSKRNVLITNQQMYHGCGLQDQKRTLGFLFVEYWVLISSDDVKFWSMISQSFFLYLFSKLYLQSDVKQTVRGRSLPDRLLKKEMNYSKHN